MFYPPPPPPPPKEIGKPTDGKPTDVTCDICHNFAVGFPIQVIPKYKYTKGCKCMLSGRMDTGEVQ